MSYRDDYIKISNMDSRTPVQIGAATVTFTRCKHHRYYTVSVGPHTEQFRWSTDVPKEMLRYHDSIGEHSRAVRDVLAFIEAHERQAVSA